MGFLDEFKRLAHPYEDEEDEEFEDDYEPSPAPSSAGSGSAPPAASLPTAPPPRSWRPAGATRW